jgi:hypothetical protein
VLLAPGFVRRAAAAYADGPEQAWMLRQPRAVRESFVYEVLDPYGTDPVQAQVWMLRQPEAVRESYVREVLQGSENPPTPD